MLYPYIPSPRGGTRDSGGRDLKGCSHKDTARHRGTCVLARDPGTGLGKQNLASLAEQTAEPEREPKAGI